MTQQRRLHIMASLLLMLAAFAHVTLAAESFQEILCAMINPELKSCGLYCPEGKAWQNGCPICACKSSLCQQKYCHISQSCQIEVLQAGQYSDQITHVAVCKTMARDLGPEPTTQPPTTTQSPVEYLGSCDYQGRCDVSGKCPTSDAVCRKDGLCCKMKGDGYDLGGATLGMARCMEEPDLGQCRALGVQYVYNKEAGKCESMMDGGCVNSKNSFVSMEECQKTCEHPCQKPKTLGRCRASIPRYYFNEEKEACEAFDLGGCAGTDNYFMTPWDCETHCKGLKKKASVPTNPNPVRGQQIYTTPPPTAYPTNVGDQISGERETLRDRIIKGFYNQDNNIEDRGNPTIDNTGGIDFKPRPQPGRRVYTLDEYGNVIYVNKPATYTPYQQVTTAPPVIDRNNNNNNGQAYVHLGDRIRSAHNVVDNYQQGQVNYNNLRSRPSGDPLPTYQDRGFTSYSQGGYQSSVNALRKFLTRN